jgi:hypothetical protein
MLRGLPLLLVVVVLAGCHEDRLAVAIYDGRTWSSGEKSVLYQGSALGRSDVTSFDRAAPYLVQALFKNFPGDGVQTALVSIPLSEPGEPVAESPLH